MRRARRERFPITLPHQRGAPRVSGLAGCPHAMVGPCGVWRGCVEGHVPVDARGQHAAVAAFGHGVRDTHWCRVTAATATTCGRWCRSPTVDVGGGGPGRRSAKRVVQRGLRARSRAADPRTGARVRLWRLPRVEDTARPACARACLADGRDPRRGCGEGGRDRRRSQTPGRRRRRGPEHPGRMRRSGPGRGRGRSAVAAGPRRSGRGRRGVCAGAARSHSTRGPRSCPRRMARARRRS